MPHKRNPVISERVSGLARVVRSNLQAALEDVALWHERDISHSSVERVILPDSSIAVDYALHLMTGVIDGLLIVSPSGCGRTWTRPAACSSPSGCCSALVEHGMPRDEAYAIVQRAAARTWDRRAALPRGGMA